MGILFLLIFITMLLIPDCLEADYWCVNSNTLIPGCYSKWYSTSNKGRLWSYFLITIPGWVIRPSLVPSLETGLVFTWNPKAVAKLAVAAALARSRLRLNSLPANPRLFTASNEAFRLQKLNEQFQNLWQGIVVVVRIHFFNVGPPKEHIFFTTIFSLNFSHHYTNSPDGIAL